MELFFLCTALSLHVLDHCMKLYWKRKTQRTAGPTDRPTDRPPGDSYIPPQTSFRGYNNLFKPETPKNRTFSLVLRVSGKKGFHNSCVICQLFPLYSYIKVNYVCVLFTSIYL